MEIVKDIDKILVVDDNGCSTPVYPCYKYGISGSHAWVMGGCGTSINFNPDHYPAFDDAAAIKAFLAECNAALCASVSSEPIDPEPVEPPVPCVPITFELIAGTYCKADIIAIAQDSNPAVTEWYGWSVVLEKPGGLDIDDNVAETCCAITEGSHGTKQLDGAGASWTVAAGEAPLGDQCFEVKPGSILEFNGAFK